MRKTIDSLFKLRNNTQVNISKEIDSYERKNDEEYDEIVLELIKCKKKFRNLKLLNDIKMKKHCETVLAN